MRHKDEQIAIVGTDYDFFALLETDCRVLSPVSSDSWYLDKKDFRQAIRDRVKKIPLTSLDIFVIYNLAPNDNMKTHIKGIGFASALNRFVKWSEANPIDTPRTSLEDYLGFLSTLTDNQKTADDIYGEMARVYITFGWNGVDESTLNPGTSESTGDSNASMYVNSLKRRSTNQNQD